MVKRHLARKLVVAFAAERQCLCEQGLQWGQVTVVW